MQQYTWFYSLKSTLSPETKQALEVDFAQFLNQWKTHGTPVDGLINLQHDRFIIIQSDPGVSRPSGCSIDSLKQNISQIISNHGLEVLDAANVFYRSAEGQIDVTHFSKISALVAKGTLTPETIVFDHSLDQSDDLSKWELPMSQTWFKPLFLN